MVLYQHDKQGQTAVSKRETHVRINDAYPNGIEDGWLELGGHAQPAAGEAIFVTDPDGLEKPLIDTPASRAAQTAVHQQIEAFETQAKNQ